MIDEAIPAATLIVWRDPRLGDEKLPEILVVERSAGMAFAAGAIVFPGGRVDSADRALAEVLNRPHEAAKITAIRETIEETAVIPALDSAVDPALGSELQQALLDGADFEALIAQYRLDFSLDA